VPAPAVIPAPIAYVKVVAVKTLVVAVGLTDVALFFPACVCLDAFARLGCAGRVWRAVDVGPAKVLRRVACLRIRITRLWANSGRV